MNAYLRPDQIFASFKRSCKDINMVQADTTCAGKFSTCPFFPLSLKLDPFQSDPHSSPRCLEYFSVAAASIIWDDVLADFSGQIFQSSEIVGWSEGHPLRLKQINGQGGTGLIGRRRVIQCSWNSGTLTSDIERSFYSGQISKLFPGFDMGP